MGLSRRFLNLIVSEHPTRIRRVTSLRSIDLGRHELFYPPCTMPPAASKLEELTLPTPTIIFKASRWGCLPVADRKVLCTGQRQHAFLFDAATRHVVTIPTRRVVKKWKPVVVFVPSGDSDANGDDDPDGTLFVLEAWPNHEAMRLGPESEQFEALVYRRRSLSSPAKSWHSQLLPPLPYLRDPKYWKFNVGVTSYAVVGGGSHICVSLEESAMSSSDERTEIKKEIAGTYCLDTASHTWSKVGNGTLPFVGKVEYVPELRLWFGISFSDGYGKLAAADLSAMDSEPQLVGAWEVETDHPALESFIKENPTMERYWEEVAAPMETLERNNWGFGLFPFSRGYPDPKLAYLGSGRFCIASFFKPAYYKPEARFISAERLAVLTGVEVTPPQVSRSRHDGGKANELQMICHKSRVLLSTDIDAMF